MCLRAGKRHGNKLHVQGYQLRRHSDLSRPARPSRHLVPLGLICPARVTQHRPGQGLRKRPQSVGEGCPHCWQAAMTCPPQEAHRRRPRALPGCTSRQPGPRAPADRTGQRGHGAPAAARRAPGPLPARARAARLLLWGRRARMYVAFTPLLLVSPRRWRGQGEGGHGGVPARVTG